MLEIFCNTPLEVVSKMKALHYEEIVSQLYDVLTQKPELVTEFKMGNTLFGFIPSLEDMTFGEYIDLDTYIGDMQQAEKAMAVLYRPITQKINGKYSIDEYRGDLFHEAMLEMPMDAVVSATLFFYNLGIDLSNVMMNSLQGEDKAQQQSQVSGKSGGGINHYSNLVKEILDDSKIYPSSE